MYTTDCAQAMLETVLQEFGGCGYSVVGLSCIHIEISCYSNIPNYFPRYRIQIDKKKIKKERQPYYPAAACLACGSWLESLTDVWCMDKEINIGADMCILCCIFPCPYKIWSNYRIQGHIFEGKRFCGSENFLGRHLQVFYFVSKVSCLIRKPAPKFTQVA